MDIGVSVGPHPEGVSWMPDTFDFVELSIGEGEFDPGEIDRDALAAALDRGGYGLAVHLPFRQPLVTGVERIDAANRAYLAELLGVAGELGADVAVVHLTARAARREEATLARERAPEAMRELCGAGAEHGVTVCFENVGNVGGLPLDLVGELAATADVPLCLDIGHAVEERDQDAVEGFIREHAARIEHLHVHDVRRRGDTHIPVGSGEIDVGAVGGALVEAGVEATATIEVFSDDREYLRLSAERFRAAV